MLKKLIFASVFLFSVPSVAVLTWAMVKLIPKSMLALLLGIPWLVFIFGILVPIRFWISDE